MKNLILLFSILFAIGCYTDLPLEDRVIAIHDEVMPRMGEIHEAKKKLRAIDLNLLSKQDETIIKKSIIYLEKADEGMMTWMAEWKVPETEPDKTAYLNKELVRVSKVKKDIIQSIINANELIKKHGK